MILEERHGATAVVTLNQPARKNALAMPMREALIAAFERIEADPSVRAVVVNPNQQVATPAGRGVPALPAGSVLERDWRPFRRVEVGVQTGIVAYELRRYSPITFTSTRFLRRPSNSP